MDAEKLGKNGVIVAQGRHDLMPDLGRVQRNHRNRRSDVEQFPLQLRPGRWSGVAVAHARFIHGVTPFLVRAA